MHAAPSGQALPHLPQLPASFATSMHALPHFVRPPPQAQLPAAHTNPESHCTLQAPQLVVLVLRSAQLAPHGVSPVWHCLTQLPFEHSCPLGQGFPHTPQFCPSDLKSTQAPLHGLNVAAHWQAPREQTEFAPHAWPQLPQFRASLCVSVQPPEQ